MDNLKFHIHCVCGGSITFKVNSTNLDKQYTCPNCSENLGIEVMDMLINVKDSLQHHCENCGPLTNVKQVNLHGQLI